MPLPIDDELVVIAVDPELVPRDELADPLDLIWLRHPALGLHPVFGERARVRVKGLHPFTPHPECQRG
jgi:hypothetical protein